MHSLRYGNDNDNLAPMNTYEALSESHLTGISSSSKQPFWITDSQMDAIAHGCKRAYLYDYVANVDIPELKRQRRRPREIPFT